MSTIDHPVNSQSNGLAESISLSGLLLDALPSVNHTPKVPPLPGYNVFEPGDTEFYLYGRLEGRRTEDYRAGARTDIHRMLNYHNCVDQYITGPFGPTSGPEVKVQPGPNNVVLPSAGTLPMPKPQPSTSSTASPSAGVPQPPR